MHWAYRVLESSFEDVFYYQIYTILKLNRMLTRLLEVIKKIINCPFYYSKG